MEQQENEKAYWGISSAMWVTQSIAPIANAPFSMPARKTNPSLEYPVMLVQPFQTKSFEAYPAPDRLDMTAQTMTIMKKPATMKNDPNLLIHGSAR